MIDYIVEAKSRSDLRNLANKLRQHLGLENRLWIPIVELLDIFTTIFDDFTYEIAPDSKFSRGIHAETDVRNGHIKIKESVYNRASNGEGRDRMTIAHEIGHYFTLCFCGFKLQKTFTTKNISAYQQPEWQAKCFAGEFMISRKLTQEMSPKQIAKACGVSLDAANYQYKQNRKH